jgi:5-bromo-4-chloroindolyl phosphate hydrolysis protein
MFYKATANIGYGDKIVYKNQPITDKDYDKIPKQLQTKFVKVHELKKIVKVESEPNKGKEK